MRFRFTLAAAVTFAGIVTAAAATESRAPGAYASLTVANAAACARACADDGICMSWSLYRDNVCQLSAVVAAASNSQALATGFAARAPAFLQPRTPVVEAQSVNTREETAPQSLAVAEEPSLPETPPADDLVLLGGPEEGDLRLGLR